MKNESREIRTMRLMAWARAKGELASLLETYWEEDIPGISTRYEAFKRQLDTFIEVVESEGHHE